MSIEYRIMTTADRHWSPNVCSMMAGLYAEDPPSSPAPIDRFPVTIETLLTQPHLGTIVLIWEELPIGYALLIPYWSNEFGGIILMIDELYIEAPHRGRGIGRGFFEWLTVNRRVDHVALMLEVSPRNHAARRLYESLGFTERSNRLLIRR
ncbi:GNAT family N-acetyltransferase [Tuwongella immobilis]|uniref:N-acetyltransferase domain-containing protein n=1 Tax=Tuwongella immobilis TaxID=692036 RepID=A0A6C2YJ42_9BACT|nr:GNAT family N-acetyltransferase [Tuwongella immobilis]VIP01105.1 gcn5-related n-acetyltransferase : Uncharacterized protein OS=Sporocytophaga myxococcoides GN=MYP_3712 PE=4 SV=1: Acetyltransf_1 [Tuwongella immobilis]VTR97635.1 gcn5-related n-acetyltransferase : Uncharacterized protein OS=Sporocytophaga myxococcoides GN=MYP_3712 PE=4 SV=1: Acetyltransf_1 [Tuwongella immobilis]